MFIARWYFSHGGKSAESGQHFRAVSRLAGTTDTAHQLASGGNINASVFVAEPGGWDIRRWHEGPFNVTCCRAWGWVRPSAEKILSDSLQFRIFAKLRNS
jgi:hypothetical protein